MAHGQIDHSWHRVDKELPPPFIKVLVTDGYSISFGWYDCHGNEWRSLLENNITHWALPQKK